MKCGHSLDVVARLLARREVSRRTALKQSLKILAGTAGVALYGAKHAARVEAASCCGAPACVAEEFYHWDIYPAGVNFYTDGATVNCRRGPGTNCAVVEYRGGYLDPDGYTVQGAYICDPVWNRGTNVWYLMDSVYYDYSYCWISAAVTSRMDDPSFRATYTSPC